MAQIERHHGAYLITGRGHGKHGTLVQTDWDYPSTAKSFGWSLRRVQRRGTRIVHLSRVVSCARNCDHSGTDGTVTCPDCGIAAGEFIANAAAFLDGKCW